MHRNVLRLFALIALAVTSSLAFAGSDTAYQNTTILTIQIVQDIENKTYKLGIDDLDALPQVAFETSTIWTEGVVAFSGPSLREVLESVDAKPKTIRAFALNDYNMVIAMTESDDTYPIVATRMNGERFSVRDRGPLWLVYPYDSG
ncbi:MAG: hypothetical protein RLN85_11480, partial [Pseudomonadales bacterium]